MTGANGALGSNLVRVLVAAGHRVRGLVRPTADVRALADQPLELVRGDVLDRVSLLAAMEGCDVVFHCAAVYAYWGYRGSELERVTVEGTRSAIEAAHTAGVGRFVLTSSSVVCGSSRQPVVRDESANFQDPDPPPYFVAKVKQEAEALELARRLGLNLVSVCPTVVVGPHDYRLGPSNAIIVRYLEDPFRVTLPGGCNIVHAEDVARGHLLAAEHGESGRRYLLGGENLEWSLLHGTISELCGLPGPALLATHTAAYLAASAMELVAAATGKPPASTRVQAKTLGRYYWYGHDRAAELGYSPRSARSALADAIAWLLVSPHISPAVRRRLRPGREVLAHDWSLRPRAE